MISVYIFQDGSFINTVDGGTIDNDQFICYGASPAIIGVSLDSGEGALTYEWETSPDGSVGSWTPFTTPETDATLNPGALTSTIYYKRKTISTLNNTPCPVYSDPVKIEVSEEVIGGTAYTSTVIDPDQTVCDGDIPIDITIDLGTGTQATGVSYQWQSSTTNSTGGFTDITGAATTAAAYGFSGTPAQTTYYKRRSFIPGTSNTCEAYSTVSAVFCLVLKYGYRLKLNLSGIFIYHIGGFKV